MSRRPDPGARRGPSRLVRDESGAAILEFALVLPLLAALVFGCFEVGRALSIQRAMDEAVRGGARYLARAPNPFCEPACSAGAAHAVRMTADQIVANARLERAAITVEPLREPPFGTVVMTASVALRIDLIAVAPPVWTLTARHQEQRVAE